MTTLEILKEALSILHRERRAATPAAYEQFNALRAVSDRVFRDSDKDIRHEQEMELARDIYETARREWTGRTWVVSLEQDIEVMEYAIAELLARKR